VRAETKKLETTLDEELAHTQELVHLLSWIVLLCMRERGSEFQSNRS